MCGARWPGPAGAISIPATETGKRHCVPDCDLPVMTPENPFQEEMLATEAPIARHPAAWLQPLPEGYTIPLWRWILLPATALMLRRNKGVWVSGELQLLPDRLRFTETRMSKSSRNPLRTWEILFTDIRDLRVKKSLAAETVEIDRGNAMTRLMTVRSDDFMARVREALEGMQET